MARRRAREKMKPFIIRKDSWKRAFAATYIGLAAASALLMFIGIILSFYDVEPSGTILIVSGFCTVFGLFFGLLTNPHGFGLLLEFAEHLRQQEPV